VNDERDAAARRDFQASVCPLADEVAPRQPLEAVIVEPGAGGHGGRALRSPGRRLRVAHSLKFSALTVCRFGRLDW